MTAANVELTFPLKPAPRALEPISIGFERADQADIIALIDELDAYQKPLYPPESHHGIDIAALTCDNVLFAVARTERGEAAACGAIVLKPEFGEIKRMFTADRFRGQGIARALLSFLEHEARARGCRHSMLETGNRQHEAIALYERSGYVFRAPFGDYVEDPNSVFLEKVLS